MRFDILNRWSGAVQFSAEIECDEDQTTSVKLGLAVKVALKSGANLSEADLSRANLSRANLSEADLSGASLSWADLCGADLSGANLSWANLSEADLSRANLSGADLSLANLIGADLSGADLSRANLSEAKNLAQVRWGADGNYGSNSPMNLRNVPEKPPIKWVKAWVNVYPNTGLNIPNQTKEAADKLCSNIRVACIEIDWPVYDEEAGK